MFGKSLPSNTFPARLSAAWQLPAPGAGYAVKERRERPWWSRIAECEVGTAAGLRLGAGGYASKPSS